MHIGEVVDCNGANAAKQQVQLVRKQSRAALMPGHGSSQSRLVLHSYIVSHLASHSSFALRLRPQTQLVTSSSRQDASVIICIAHARWKCTYILSEPAVSTQCAYCVRIVSEQHNVSQEASASEWPSACQQAVGVMH